MALIAGDAVQGTGLAGKIAEKMAARLKGFDAKKGEDAINALAEAIVEYITDEAEVTVTGVTSGGDTASGTVE